MSGAEAAATPATGSLLDRPAEESARRIAMEHLESARRARTALDAGDDPEALHDLRVALRRLRSAVRAFGDELRPAIGKKLRRRLRKLARATHPGRDAEVGESIVARWIADAAPAPERRAAGELERRLAARRESAYGALDARFRQRVDALLDKLEARLGVWRREVRISAPPTPSPTLRRRVGEELARHRERFETALEAAASGAPEAAHAARIEAKRLRYLLEPIADELPEAAPPVRRLKRLQDRLGDANDLAMLADELAAMAAESERGRLAHLAGVGARGGALPGGRRGQRALALRIAGERRELVAAFERAWLPPRGDELRQAGRELDALAAALSG